MPGLTRFALSLQHGVEALAHTSRTVDHAAAERVVERLLKCGGRRFTTGVGKSGLIAARMASSLSSIGLPSQWVHGAEWAHGELGNLRGDDVIVAVSNSGRTAELLWLGEQLARRGDGGALVALTGSADSPLARASSVALACAVPAECETLAPLPTSSLLAADHVFNALLCELAARTQLSDDDVRRSHPGGAIGDALGRDST